MIPVIVNSRTLGGMGGSAFEDKLSTRMNGAISRIDVWQGQAIDGIQVFYGGEAGDLHGHNHSAYHRFDVPEGHILCAVNGWVGKQNGHKVVKALQFGTRAITPAPEIARAIKEGENYSLDAKFSPVFGVKSGKMASISDHLHPILSVRGRSGNLIDLLYFEFGYRQKAPDITWPKFPVAERDDHAAFSTGTNSAPHISRFTQSWMSYLSDDLRLSQISIPATHDSATYKLLNNLNFAKIVAGILLPPLLGVVGLVELFAKTQDCTLEQQLESGVRSIDLRLQLTKNSFDLFHGIVDLEISLFQALDQVKAFLEKNVSEAVIVNIAVNSEQFDARHFDKLWADVLKKGYPFLGKHPEGENSPKLKDVRGKILVFSNVETQNLEVGFSKAWIEAHAVGVGSWQIQAVSGHDDFNDANAHVSIAEKKVQIAGGLTMAMKNLGPKLIATSLSGNGAPALDYTPIGVAKETNSFALKVMKDMGFPNHLGIVSTDFPGSGLIWAVLRSNFAKAR